MFKEGKVSYSLLLKKKKSTFKTLKSRRVTLYVRFAKKKNALTNPYKKKKIPQKTLHIHIPPAMSFF